MKSFGAENFDDPDFAFLNGGGELARIIHAFDWSATSLGPIANWPQSLKTSASIVLRTAIPMIMLWGPDGIMIYNDAYATFAGGRHPAIVGAKVREGWPEVASFNDHVMRVGLDGGTLSFADQELTLYRNGRPEQVWMNLEYAPILNEMGRPAGVLAIVIETTAKVLAERWQQEEHERQSQMFEQAPGFMAMLVGPTHVFQLANAAYRQLVGHRDVIGKPVGEALPEIVEQGFVDLLNQVYTTGVPFLGKAVRAELQRTIDAAKEERFIDLVDQPVRNARHEVVGIFVQGMDVTDHLEAQRALLISEAKFRTLAEALPNQVWTALSDGRLDWFNQRIEAYSGLTRSQLIGHGWTAMVHPDDLAIAERKWSSALVSGTPYETEFRLRRQDGTYRWHLARAVPMPQDLALDSRWIGTNTDIDDQKQVVQALSKSERRLQLSQAAAGIASLELDIASGMVAGSETFWDLWGLTPRDSVHISVLEHIVLPEDRAIRSSAETRAQGTAVRTVEYRIRRPDTGEIRWLSRHIDFVWDSHGKPVSMFGVMQDITDRKDAQARQQLLLHELEHRIKNILAMVSSIASQTLRNTTIEAARVAFSQRMVALAAAHDILTSTHWSNASMREIIVKSIAVFPVEQFTILGDPLSISPKMALSLALAVNELGTNAVKYGSLTTSAGHVSIDWKPVASGRDARENLVWTWTETGGPAVSVPTHRGFGSILIQRVLAADFNGHVTVEYHPDGLKCVLVAPLPLLTLA